MLYFKVFHPRLASRRKILNAEEMALLARRLADDNGTGAARMYRLDKPTLKLILIDWKIWTG
jgi:hypothetical protein